MTKVVDIRKVYKGRHFKVVKCDNPLYDIKKRYKVAFWAASNCNLKYDFFGVLGFIIPFFRHIKNKFFCSENALFALQKDFPAALGFLPPEECMPADFLDSYYFEVVYEGCI